MAQVIKRARVSDNLYVGNVGAACELSFLGNADISNIINLSTTDLDEPVAGIKYFDFMLSTNEMLDAEMARMTDKLTRIAECIGGCSGTTLVVCNDGINLCMLVAGYFLIKMRASPYASLIERLETLYLTDTQREAEITERRALETDGAAVGKIASKMTSDDAREYWEARNIRRPLLCLTNASFRKLLRIAGGEPQRKARIVGARRPDY